MPAPVKAKKPVVKKTPVKKTTKSEAKKPPVKKTPVKTTKTKATAKKTESAEKAPKKPATKTIKKTAPEAVSTDLMTTPTLARTMFNEESSSLVVIPVDLTPEQRRESVRDLAKRSRQMEGCLELVQGELLYEIKANNYWKEWGFKNFNDYIEEEMEFKWRKGRYLVEMYEKFVVELGLPKEQLVNMEWSKAKELISVITPTNAKGLLNKLQKQSLRETKVMVNKMKAEKAGDPIVEEEVHRLVAVLHGDQIKNVQQALAHAKAESGSDSIGNLLDLICTSYLANAD